MNETETSAVLAKISIVDRRDFRSKATIAFWHELLEPYLLQDALDAVADYYRYNSGWIMPAHIIERIREVEEVRAERAIGSGGLSQADEDAALSEGTEAYTAARRELRRAARHGQIDRATYQRYTRENLRLTDVLQGQA